MRSTLDPERLRADVEAARQLFQRGSPALSRRRYRTLLLRVDTAHEVEGAAVEQLGHRVVRGGGGEALAGEGECGEGRGGGTAARQPD